MGMTMKLSVITITSRVNPRLAEMCHALAANLTQHEAVKLEWIVVDEKLWYDTAEREESYTPGRLWAQAQGDRLAHRFAIQHVMPKPSKWRGPDVAVDRPDPNSARNTGLAHVTGEYVAFVDDCTLVGAGWLETLLACAAKDAGYRCNIAFPRDALFRMPANGLVRDREVADRLVELSPTTVAGIAFGAPLAAFEAIGGFDESYGGGSGCEELDAFVRLARTGLRFYGSRAGWVYHLKAADARDEVVTVSEVFHAEKNKQRFNALLGDRRRTWPATEQPSIAEIRDRLCDPRDLAQGDIDGAPDELGRDNGDRRQPYETSLVEEIPFRSDGMASASATAGTDGAREDPAQMPGDSDREHERDPAGDPAGKTGPVAES